MQSLAGWLSAHFDYTFADDELLARALTHRSAAGRNNERLEFLGDAVLNAVAADIVFRKQPRADEGSLSRLRSALVRDATLAKIAREIGLGEHLILGPGELKSGGFRRASILADAMEAIIGAIYLESGFAAAECSIRTLLRARAEQLPVADELKDPKTRLQEWLQAGGYELPEYRTESVTGAAHRQHFDVSCTVGALGHTTSGEGTSRRDAEQDAARKMLELLDAPSATGENL